MTREMELDFVFMRVRGFLDKSGFLSAGVHVDKRIEENGIFIRIPSQLLLSIDWKIGSSSNINNTNVTWSPGLPPIKKEIAVENDGTLEASIDAPVSASAAENEGATFTNDSIKIPDLENSSEVLKDGAVDKGHIYHVDPVDWSLLNKKRMRLILKKVSIGNESQLVHSSNDKLSSKEVQNPCKTELEDNSNRNDDDHSIRLTVNERKDEMSNGDDHGSQTDHEADNSDYGSSDDSDEFIPSKECKAKKKGSKRKIKKPTNQVTTCHSCQITFDSNSLYQRHYYFVHNKKRNLKVPKAGELFNKIIFDATQPEEMERNQEHWDDFHKSENLIKNETDSITPQCPNCNFLFPDQKTFLRHYIKCHTALEYNTKTPKCPRCIKCRIRFSSRSEYHLHYRNHHRSYTSVTADNISKDFPCPHCPYTTISTKYLKMHLLCHKKKAFSCPKCLKNFRRKEYVRLHVKRVHTEKQLKVKQPMIEEEIDGKKVGRKKTTNRKLPEVRTCHSCKITFNSNRNYQRHYYFFHKNKQKEVKPLASENGKEDAEKCTVKVDREDSRELAAEGGTDSVARHCPKCDFLLPNEKSYLRHYSRCQTVPKYQNPTPRCIRCRIRFSNRSDYHRHYRLHHYKKYVGEIDQSVVCEFCGDKFTQLTLDRHLKAVHKDGLKVFPCSECPFKSHSKSLTADHFTQKHTNEEFPCPQCPHRAASKNCLRKHLICHKDRTFPCPVCQKKFPRKEALKTHVKGVHTDERPDVCEVCNKRFHSPHMLKRHFIGVHSGQRFACPHCSASYSQRADLKRHIDKTHTASATLNT